MTIYFLIDTSGSMEGAKIGALNDAMTNIITELQSENVDIDVSVLQYASSTKWMYDHPVPISEFEWENLYANGMTAMGTACIEIAKTLNEGGDSTSIVIIISDGYPTDDFEEGIAAINGTPSFLSSKRYAVAVDGADIDALTKFTGSQGNVFPIQDLNNLTDVLSNILSESIPQQMNMVVPKTDSDDEWD